MFCWLLWFWFSRPEFKQHTEIHRDSQRHPRYLSGLLPLHPSGGQPADAGVSAGAHHAAGRAAENAESQPGPPQPARASLRGLRRGAAGAHTPNANLHAKPNTHTPTHATLSSTHSLPPVFKRPFVCMCVYRTRAMTLALATNVTCLFSTAATCQGTSCRKFLSGQSREIACCVSRLEEIHSTLDRLMELNGVRFLHEAQSAKGKVTCFRISSHFQQQKKSNPFRLFIFLRNLLVVANARRSARKKTTWPRTSSCALFFLVSFLHRYEIVPSADESFFPGRRADVLLNGIRVLTAVSPRFLVRLLNENCFSRLECLACFILRRLRCSGYRHRALLLSSTLR